MTKSEILSYLLNEIKGIVSGAKLKDVVDKVLSYVDSNVVPNYKEYTFLFRQNGTAAPNPIVVVNTFDSAFTWTRIGIGEYKLFSANFDGINDSKLTISITNNSREYVIGTSKNIDIDPTSFIGFSVVETDFYELQDSITQNDLISIKIYN